jgi:cytochrome c-type biogenesis protein CcsB
MSETAFFTIAFGAYALAAAAYFFFLFSGRDKAARAGFLLAAAGWAAHTGAIIARTVTAGRAPLANMYESVSFLAWASAVAFLGMELKFKIRKAGPFVLLIVLGLMALASSPLMPGEISPLVPALQSYWLWLHVSVTLIGEAFFAVAFVTAILYLISEQKARTAGDSGAAKAADLYDRVTYRAVAAGFPLFTLGALVFGMIWAERAWGRYWSWDPKETWSFITWMVYALYLHTRIVMGWKGRRSAVVAILGFLAALFTYFGVNYLLSGLHSYN